MYITTAECKPSRQKYLDRNSKVREKMKILLTHAYTKENKGDAAIVSVLLRQLNTAFPGSNITVSIYDDDAKYKSFEGCKVISNSMYLSLYRFQSLLYKLLFTFYLE